MSTAQLTKLNVIGILAQHFGATKKEELDPAQCESKVNEIVSGVPKFKGLDPGEAKKVYAPIIASIVSNGIPNTYKELLVESILDNSKDILDAQNLGKLQGILSAIDPNDEDQLRLLSGLHQHLESKSSTTEHKAQGLLGGLRMLERFPAIDGSSTLKQQITEVQRKLVEHSAPPASERETQDRAQEEPEAEPSMWQSALKWARRGIVTILTALGAKNLLFNSESGWVRPIVQLLAAFGISRIDFESHGDEERTAAVQPAH